MIRDHHYFTQFLPNIESIPFSDEETCQILNIKPIYLSKMLNSNQIQKTIEIHYRFDISLNFIGLYDIFEYALRRNLHFLNYGSHPEVNELVCGLVDEMAFIVDNCLSNAPPAPFLDDIKSNIKVLCGEYAEKWRQYWLFEGEPFSSAQCSTIALQTWCDVFESAMLLVCPLEEYLDPSNRVGPYMNAKNDIGKCLVE